MINSNTSYHTRNLAALLKKDFLIPLYTMKPVQVVAFVLIILFMGSTSFTLSMAVALVLITTGISMDEKYKVDSFLCSLPVKRSTIVFTKYLNAWLLILGFVSFTVISHMVTNLVNPSEPEFISIFEGVLYSFLIMFNAVGIFLPAHFKFIGNFNKSVLSFAFVFIVVAIFVVLIIFLIFYSETILDEPLLPVWCTIGTILLNAISLFLSNYFYKKQELTI